MKENEKDCNRSHLRGCEPEETHTVEEAGHSSIKSNMKAVRLHKGN